MRILIVGKYPPIEGGVSSHTYWLARGLAEAGHTVTVVTNAGLVEPDYRIVFDEHMHAIKDRKNFIPDNVTLLSLQKHAAKHAPYSESYLTRLVNSGLRAIETNGADVIFAHYLEPYGMAAMILRDLTGVPYVVRHAGSDIHKLLRGSDMTYVLSRVFQRADHVFLGRPIDALGRELGILKRRTNIPVRRMHPSFSPEGEKYVFPKEWDIPAGTPIILYMGKAGKEKGILEMLEALTTVKDDFRFLLFTKGEILPQIQKKIEEHDVLRKKVIRSDFIPPWKVPALLRSVDLYMQLENNFPVTAHTPTQALEAICCGTPIILSGEMVRRNANALPNAREQFAIVEDPKDIDSLATVVSKALKELPKLKDGALAAQKELRAQQSWDDYIKLHIDVFTRVLRSPLGQLFHSLRSS